VPAVGGSGTAGSFNEIAAGFENEAARVIGLTAKQTASRERSDVFIGDS